MAEPKIPDADHPITIAPAPSSVVVVAAGQDIAATSEALLMHEAAYKPVLYIPRADVNMALLTRTDHTSYCPYKGDCSYYSIAAAGERGQNAVWSYEQPYDAVAQIAGYLAFYPDRVDAIREVSPGP